jgi:glucan phosphoethanolaminetransferase (alkaline phosphatase superfamily)
MQLANLTEQESKNMNIVGFVIAMIVIVIFGLLMFRHFFKVQSNIVRNIIYGLSAIYLILVVAASIVYFVYRNDREAVSSDNSDIVIKPLAAMIIGVCVVGLIKYIIDHSGTKTGGSYYALSSTSEGFF